MVLQVKNGVREIEMQGLTAKLELLVRAVAELIMRDGSATDGLPVSGLGRQDPCCPECPRPDPAHKGGSARQH